MERPATGARRRRPAARLPSGRRRVKARRGQAAAAGMPGCGASSALFPAGSVTQAILEAGLVELTMLVPLRHLALKVWADGGPPTAGAESDPPGVRGGSGAGSGQAGQGAGSRFVMQWQETLEPLRRLVASFAKAFESLEALAHPPPGASAGSGLCEASLYHFELGAAWPWSAPDGRHSATSGGPPQDRVLRGACHELPAHSADPPRRGKRARGCADQGDAARGPRALEARFEATAAEDPALQSSEDRPVKRKRLSEGLGRGSSLVVQAPAVVGSAGCLAPKVTRSGVAY